MKCRHVAFWVALSACVALLAPAAASARTTRVVRDASGSRVGTVSGPKDTGSYWFYRHASAFVAYVFEEEVNLWYARNGGTAEGGYYIRRSNSAPRWRLLNYCRTRIIGRVVRRGGQWVVQQRSNGEYSTKGRVDDSCPAWVSGGAVCWLVRGFPME